MLHIARIGRATCLERSLLRQAWLLRVGVVRDVVIGVRRNDELVVHAWLSGDPDESDYLELHRISSDRDRLGAPLG